MKRKVILFQKDLRKPVKRYGAFLKDFEFVNLHPQIADSKTYRNLPSFEGEIHRRKDGVIHRVRRMFGIPNIRPVFVKDGDLLFSNGYLLLTNRPYCVYVENGTMLYGYDRRIARHPVAKALFAFLIRRKNLRKLIFMSETSQKSFLSSADYPESTKKVIREKSVRCYPAIDTSADGVTVKTSDGKLRILFAGLFYMKGGVEILNAFERIAEKYPDVTLTVVTARHIVRDSDIARMESMQGVTLLDAALSEKEMDEMYRTHHVFLLPTFRDSVPAVLLEALSFGMPLIINDQYATHEFVGDGVNGFVFRDHPMQDYEPDTYGMRSRYFNPEVFYERLFRLQREGKTKPVEDFIHDAIEKFILDPSLVETFSRNSLKRYREEFHYRLCAEHMESILHDALRTDHETGESL